MNWSSAILKAALLVLNIAVIAGFLAPRNIFTVAAISLKPQLVAASFVLAVALWLHSAPLSALYAALLGVLGTAFLVPYYRSAPPIADPEITIVWANVFKQASSANAALRLAEAQNADYLAMAEAPLDMAVPAGWHARSGTRPVYLLSRQPGPKADILGDGRLGMVRLDEGPFELIAAHFQMPLSGWHAPKMRREHFDILVEEAREHPTVVVGDFNTVPWSADLHDLEDRNLHRLDIGRKTTWFSRLLLLGLPIDHVLVTPSTIDASAEVGPGIGSDHRPLIVRVRLKTDSDA